jgi:hypothetical protein
MTSRALVLALVILAAGCGGRGGAGSQSAESTGAQPKRPAATTPKQAPSANPFPDDPQILARATTTTQRKALGTLARDIAAMRAASARARHTLKGTPATRRATSRFIADLERSTIDNLSKNRLIDHAAAAVAPTCDQCFQQLEAMRPIPAIAH